MITRFIVLIVFYVLVSCTLQAQDMEWLRLRGIKGSYITSITQTKSGAVFVSTPYGVWRSADTLKTWKNVSFGLRDSLIYSLAATGDGGLLLSTYEGVYRSSNDGEKWSVVTPNPGLKSYRYLKAHPNGTCFVGTRRFLFRSENHGKTWSKFADTVVKEPIPGYNARQYGLAIVGKDDRIVMPTHYSDDKGKTWKTHKFSAWSGFGNMFADNTGKIIAGTLELWYTSENDRSASFIVSEDNGASWGVFSGGASIAIEPEQYGIGRNSMMYRNAEFFIMHSSGSSYLFLDKDTILMSLFGVGIWKVTGKRVQDSYIITSKKDVTDNGFISHNPTCSYMLKDSTILVGSYGSGLFRSKDRGEHWQSIEIPDNSPIITVFYNDITYKRIFAGTTNGLFQSTNEGENWQRIDTGFHRAIITTLSVTEKGTIIVSTYNKVYRQELNSNKWTMITPLSDSTPTATQISASGSKVYITKKDLWLSNDDGKSFQLFARHEQGGIKWGGCNKLLSIQNKSNILLTVGYYGLNRYINSSWEKPKDYMYLYLDPYSNNVDGQKSSTYITSSYVSPYTNQVFFSLNCAITTYDWENNFIAKNDKKGEWLFGEWCFGITADQKGRPFAATMNGIAYSRKADKDWEFLPQPKDLSLPAMMSMGTDDKGYIYSSSLFGGVYRTKNPVIILQAPELISPVHKAQEIAKNSQLKWKSVIDAKNYTLQVSTDSAFTNNVVEDSLLTAITYGLEGLKENTTYYWRVRGRLFGIVSPWSETRTFSTITVYPSGVQLREPNNGAQNRNTTLNVIWNTANSTENYHVQIAKENSFSNPLLNDSTVTTTEKKIENLENGTEYFWRVRGKNKAGYGTWSEIWNFRTKGGINSIGDEEENQIQCYLTNNEIIINNNPYREEVTQITLSDITGRIVFEGVLPQGTESTRIEIPTITSGYYTLSIANPHIKIHKGILHIH